MVTVGEMGGDRLTQVRQEIARDFVETSIYSITNMAEGYYQLSL